MRKQKTQLKEFNGGCPCPCVSSHLLETKVNVLPRTNYNIKQMIFIGHLDPPSLRQHWGNGLRHQFRISQICTIWILSLLLRRPRHIATIIGMLSKPLGALNGGHYHPRIYHPLQEWYGQKVITQNHYVEVIKMCLTPLGDDQIGSVPMRAPLTGKEPRGPSLWRDFMLEFL